MSMKPQEGDCLDFVEVDPSGRYGRYNEILGKGASKTVYRAFDEFEGIEVAWNQVKLYDFLQSPEDLERLYCEIHLLKTLKHKNIMKFYTSWVDTSKRNINFITEMFTSGTLRQYRQKHRRVNVRAVKHWCRQILMGLVYLHSHDPPVIHRDLKCDNIFVNGNQGEIKIGDLGLAAILRRSQAAHCVGTPEFMAPEVFEEEYNELVDIYSFGMCVLEMVTFEYPYSECTHPAQIYKKVISGTKPDALYRVKDPEVRQFVEKCLVTATQRLPARELLKDPFLHIDGLAPVISDGNIVETGEILRQPSFANLHSNCSLFANGFSNDIWHEPDLESGWDYTDDELETHGLELFDCQGEEHFANVDITIKGSRNDYGGVFLRIRITDKDGRVRNIYFPFDVEADTALSVAAEMVAELDIIDYDVTRIAEMIDGELSALVPGWKAGPGIDESPRFSSRNLCKNCASNVSSCGSLLDYLTSENPGYGNLQKFHCSNLECAAMHGRFEEITYQLEGSELGVAEGAPGHSTSHSDGLASCEHASRGTHYHEDGDHLYSSSDIDAETSSGKKVDDDLWDSENQHHNDLSNVSGEHEIEIQQELRWLRAKYLMELREYKTVQLGESRGVLHPSHDHSNWDKKMENSSRDCPLICTSLPASNDRKMKSFHLVTNCSFRIPRNDEKQVPDGEASSGYRTHNSRFSCGRRPAPIFTAKSFYTGNLLPSPILRTKSLPVDAMDV